jgi:hypothetical protein
MFVIVSGSPSELISQLLRNVDPAGRDAFYNLSYVHFPKGLDPNDHPEEVALAIFQTNAVAAGEAVGIFPRMARLNHGCSSAFNSVYTWRQSQEALFVYALRDIRQGQVSSSCSFLSRLSLIPVGIAHNLHGHETNKI